MIGVRRSSQAGVQSAPSGARGFDTDTKLTTASAQAFVQAGFTFAIRYLSLGNSESSGDLTPQEVEEILSSSLALMAVQHVPNPGWSPTTESGSQNGQNAVNNAQSASLPPGMNIWLDLEGVNSASSASSVSQYCNAWFAEVSAAQYVPGLYVGYDAILDSSQLDALQVDYYWRSGSDCSGQAGSFFDDPYPARGYCLVQSISGDSSIDQVSYDSDVVQTDNLGSTPLWLVSGGAKRGSSKLGESQPATTNAKVSKTGFIGRIAVLAAAAVLTYAAGIVTGPLIRPKKSQPSAAVPAKPPDNPPEAATTPSSASTTPAVSAKPVRVADPAPSPAASASAGSSRSVLVASFEEPDSATSLAKMLEDAGFGHPTVGTSRTAGKLYHVVRLGPFNDSTAAARIAAQLTQTFGLHPSVQQ